MRKYIVLILLLPLFSTGVFSQKVGVVLSGGGAAGAAHVGLLKALEEHEIPIDYIVGTSVGALIGGYYAAGYSPEEIEQIITSQSFQKTANGIIDPKDDFFFKKSDDDASIIDFNFNLDSIFASNLPTNFISSIPIDYALMESFSPANAAAKGNFDSLLIPFRCLAANITERKEMIFEKGNLATAIRASMTYPFYIMPISIDGNIMFDGGIYNNFPVKTLCDNFEVDYIIASNVASAIEKPTEDNIISQVKNLLIQPTNFDIDCAKSIVVNSDVSDISTFDFYELNVALDKGYQATLELIDSIKNQVNSRRTKATIQKSRAVFNEKKPSLLFEEISFVGLHKKPASFIKQDLKLNDRAATSDEVKKSFYLLSSNEKIRSIYPKAEFNDSTGLFNLNLEVKRKKKFNASFGGVIASKPFSTGFFELDYQRLRSNELKASGNIYFGNFYNSAEAKVRYDVPFDIPFYLESQFTINRSDFFKGRATLIEESNPPFIISAERFWESGLGLPIFSSGKIVFGGSLFWKDDEYRQTRNFSRNDTSDVTQFNGSSTFIKYQVNSLNRKQYATKGLKVDFSIRHHSGKEKTIQGTTTNLNPILNENHDWININFKLDKYFLKQKAFHFGTYLEFNYSDLPFFHNYTATLLQAQSFQPLVESRTLFQESYRARSYGGVGLKTIYSIRDQVDFRLEAYLYQPYKKFERQENGGIGLSEEIIKRNLIGTFTTVYNTKVGPLAASLNYFDSNSPNFSILLHFGYVIFNKKAYE